LKSKINRAILIILILLIAVIYIGLTASKTLPQQNIDDEGSKIYMDTANSAYWYDDKNDASRTFNLEQVRVVDNNKLNQFLITIPNYSHSNLDLTVMYEMKDGKNKKLLGIVEYNIGVKYSITDDGSKLVFNSQSDDLWSIDNNGNLKKISKDSYNGIKKADIYKTEGVYEIWADAPKYIPNTNLIIYRSSLGEDGIAERKTYLWIMDDEGNNNHLVYEGALSTEVIGFLNSNEVLIYDDSKVIRFDLTNYTSKQILSEVHPHGLSPDRNILFYDANDHIGLKFLNITTGAEFEIVDIEGGLIFNGFFGWSPDGSKLAFMGVNSDTGKYSLVIASIQDKGKILQIIDKPIDKKRFSSSYFEMKWLDNNTLANKSETWIIHVE